MIDGDAWGSKEYCDTTGLVGRVWLIDVSIPCAPSTSRLLVGWIPRDPVAPRNKAVSAMDHLLLIGADPWCSQP